MKLIVGLGNPGIEYKDSRHNIGYSVISALSRKYGVVLKKDNPTFSKNAKFKVWDEQVIAAAPRTFMNLSGSSVAALVKRFKIDLSDLLVVCDDLDLELGRLRIRPSGSSGGHKGLKSIIESLNSLKFARLRIGIGRPQSKNADLADYVLSGFRNREMNLRDEAIDEALACCETWVSEGIVRVMNLFNQRSK